MTYLSIHTWSDHQHATEFGGSTAHLLSLFDYIPQEKELEASKKEKVKEAKLEAEVKMLKKENEALRRHIAVLQAEVYGARLAAKYLDKELAGR